MNMFLCGYPKCTGYMTMGLTVQNFVWQARRWPLGTSTRIYPLGWGLTCVLGTALPWLRLWLLSYTSTRLDFYGSVWQGALRYLFSCTLIDLLLLLSCILLRLYSHQKFTFQLSPRMVSPFTNIMSLTMTPEHPVLVQVHDQTRWTEGMEVRSKMVEWGGGGGH